MSDSNTIHLTVRMPADLRDRLRTCAEENRRSMNSEIVHYLDRSVEVHNAKGPAGTAIPPSQEHDQPA